MENYKCKNTYEKNIKKRFMTVTGIETVDTIGLVDSHTHLWIDTGNIINDSLSRIDDFQLIKEALIDFKKAGGSLIVDCTPYGCGRDANVLYELSRISGVKIISVTGFHKQQYYLKNSILWSISEKQAFKFFLDEIQNGFTEAKGIGSKPGAIKIAFTGILKGQYATLSLAAVKASKETGLPVVVHTEKGLNTEQLIDFFKEHEMDMSRVLLCHMDKNNNSNLHKTLIKKGVYLEYDTFLRPKYNPEDNVIPLLKDMILSGYAGKILIGSDIDNNTMWKNVGDSGGLGGFFESIEKKLTDQQIKYNNILPLMGFNSFDFFSLKNKEHF
ncbi:MAG: hypothetical protein WA097_06205 [Candidatus Hydromicrobium sp.]